MDKNSWAVCQTLLQRYPINEKKALAQQLPEKQRGALHSIPSPREDPLFSTLSLENQLYSIHSSWMAPLLRNYSESEIRLFLSALSTQQTESLQQTLLFTNHLIPLTSLAKEFLIQTLWEVLGGEQHLPLSCLPASRLDSLFSLDSRELNRLTFLLGLHDIAFEMHQIIETAKLKKIQTALKSEEQLFLKQLMQKKEPIAFKRMALTKWDGDEQTLRKAIRGRGINRLAKGAYGEHESLLFYLSRKMEMEMGVQFLKLVAPMTTLRAQEVLLQQIENAMHALQPRSSGDSQ